MGVRRVGGIQFPQVDDLATARAAVDIVRSARGSRFADTLVTVMIESPQVVENIEDIVAVDGADVAVIGMADLVRSLGHAGQAEHPWGRASFSP